MPKPVFPLRSTFLALPLEGEAREEFRRKQSLLKGFDDSLTFQSPDTPHLTLMFWSEVGELEYKGIAEQAASIAGRTRPFGLRVIGTDTFGERGRDTVLFFSVAFSPELALLKKSCPWTDRRVFLPHITIARICHPERFRIVKKDVFKRLSGEKITVSVDRLRLYGNVEGHKQTPLLSFPLRG